MQKFSSCMKQHLFFVNVWWQLLFVAVNFSGSSLFGQSRPSADYKQCWTAGAQLQQALPAICDINWLGSGCCSDRKWFCWFLCLFLIWVIGNDSLQASWSHASLEQSDSVKTVVHRCSKMMCRWKLQSDMTSVMGKASWYLSGCIHAKTSRCIHA